MTAHLSTDRRCAVCGGTVVNDRCTRCGAYAFAADLGDDRPTTKRTAIPTAGEESVLPPLSPEDLGMTQPRMTAITRDDLPIITARRPAVDAAKTDASNGSVGTVTTDTSETKALIEKSIVGTQWIMVAILVGVPLGLVTQIVMGRLGKDVLGTYSLMLVLVQAVQTFFLFGGANVIVNFIPRATAKEKSALLLSYASIALAFSVVFFLAMLIFPQALTFLLLHQAVANSTIYLFLLLFIPIIIGQTLTIAVLQGEMELGVAARTQYGVQTMSFILTLLLALVIGGFHVLPIKDAVALVPVVVLGAYIITFTTGLRALIGVMRRRWQPSLRWYLPPRFWNFTLTFHVNTIIWFFFNNIDKIVIAAIFDLNNVGIYGAAIVVATYALWAPNLFTGAMYPFFTNLVAKGDYATLRSAYQRYCAITTVIVAFVSLTVGLFAPEILQLFGKKYATAGVGGSLPLMIVFALMYTVFASAAYVPSTALITSHEDIWLNLLLNVTSLGVRVGLYGPLVTRYGLIGIAYANAVSLGVLYIATLVAVGLRYRVSVPLRQHAISLAGGVLLLGPYALEPHLPANHALQLGLRFVALLLFVGIITQLRLISAADLATVTTRLRKLPVIGKLVARVG